MVVELSSRTLVHVRALFRPSDVDLAVHALVTDCGDNLPGFGHADEDELERVRFAALRLSGGRLDELATAIQLAQTDWRDLLVAAGFAEDPEAHAQWEPRRRDADVRLAATREEESEELVQLRIGAMRESLERLGRFDAQRARERFLDGFVPGFTRHILADGQRVGFVAVKPTADALSLEHLYVRPEYQGRGIGSAVLAILFQEADSRALPLRVGALRGSDANRFYLRHGFIHVQESEWDIYYVRPAKTAGSADG